MNIISKFALATDESTDTLLNLIIELASEKFGQQLQTQQLNEFIEKYYNRKYFVSEMNSMSNQWIMVYVDNQAVGYARVTSKGEVPPAIDNMRAVRIGDFSILETAWFARNAFTPISSAAFFNASSLFPVINTRAFKSENALAVA